MAIQVWRSLHGKTLLVLLNLFSSIALIFEGYNQGEIYLVSRLDSLGIAKSVPGVMGGVSGTPDFIEQMGLGTNGVILDATHQG